MEWVSSLARACASHSPSAARPSSGSDGRADASLFLSCLPFHHFLSTVSHNICVTTSAKAQSASATAFLAAQPLHLLVLAPSLQRPIIMAPKSCREEPSKVKHATSSAASYSNDAALLQLNNFWKLPFDLQYTIILAACGPPVLHRWTVVGRTTDCTTTMLALQKTSRMFYVVVTPMLYKYVRLVRPSIMRSFHQAISIRPSLGQLVKGLHVGADNALPKEWWPMRRSSSASGGPGHRLFTLNLGPSINGGSPQWGGCSRYEYHMDNIDKDDLKASTLSAAVQAVQEGLDVRLRRKYTNYSCQPLDSDAWLVRVLEVQAALELYFLELNRCEHKAAEMAELAKKQGAVMTRKRKKADEEGKVLVSYPRLFVGDSDAPKRGFFNVTPLQIRERLASPGAPTDVFNHPYFFARVGFRWEAKGPDDELHSGGHYWEDHYDVEEIPDIFNTHHFLRNYPTLPSLSTPDPLLLARHSTDTFGGSLTLARSILTLTSSVNSLSLTGIFEFILAGEEFSSPQAVTSLTLGPDSPIDSYVPLRLDYPALQCLKRVRLCSLPHATAEDDLSGDRPTLRYLKEVQWSQTSEYSTVNPQL